MSQIQISNKTVVPLGWVLALLAGCATFTTFAFKVGGYVTGSSANAAEVAARVSKLERRVDSQEFIASRIDRRLFRMELVQGIKVPAEDRIPASK